MDIPALPEWRGATGSSFSISLMSCSSVPACHSSSSTCATCVPSRPGPVSPDAIAAPAKLRRNGARKWPAGAFRCWQLHHAGRQSHVAQLRKRHFSGICRLARARIPPGLLSRSMAGTEATVRVHRADPRAHGPAVGEALVPASARRDAPLRTGGLTRRDDPGPAAVPAGLFGVPLCPRSQRSFPRGCRPD